MYRLLNQTFQHSRSPHSYSLIKTPTPTGTTKHNRMTEAASDSGTKNVFGVRAKDWEDQIPLMLCFV